MINLKKIGAGALVALFMAGSFAGEAQVSQDDQSNTQQQAVPQLNQGAQQIDVSDADLDKFAKAYPQVQQENQKAQKKMAGVIEGEGMELQRFNEIQRAKMQNKEADVTKDEEKQVKKITSKLDKLQPELQKKVQGAATSTGLSIEKFQKIAIAIQSNPDLQKKLREKLAANVGNNK